MAYLTTDADITCGNLTVQGNLTLSGTLPNVARASLVQDDYAAKDIPFTECRIWDAYQTAITTAAADDLGLTAGAFGTGCPYITAGDCKTVTVTRYARFEVILGPEYVDGQSVRVAITAGMLTTVADATCTVDLECYLESGDTLKTGGDLVTTGAQSINSLTFGAKNFELSSASLVRGNKLDFRVAIVSTDAATGTAVTPAIAKLTFNCDIKG